MFRFRDREDEQISEEEHFLFLMRVVEFMATFVLDHDQRGCMDPEEQAAIIYALEYAREYISVSEPPAQFGPSDLRPPQGNA